MPKACERQRCEASRGFQGHAPPEILEILEAESWHMEEFGHQLFMHLWTFFNFSLSMDGVYAIAFSQLQYAIDDPAELYNMLGPKSGLTVDDGLL